MNITTLTSKPFSSVSLAINTSISTQCKTKSTHTSVLQHELVFLLNLPTTRKQHQYLHQHTLQFRYEEILFLNGILLSISSVYESVLANIIYVTASTYIFPRLSTNMPPLSSTDTFNSCLHFHIFCFRYFQCFVN